MDRGAVPVHVDGVGGGSSESRSSRTVVGWVRLRRAGLAGVGWPGWAELGRQASRLGVERGVLGG